MKKSSSLVIAGVLGLALVAGSPATAHRRDSMTPQKAGPIRRETTTLRQLVRWFGQPTSRRVDEVGCVRAVKVRWGRRLRVIAWRDRERHVAAIFVRRRTINSDRHGDLTMHTDRGLSVGDRERKLRRLYPRRRGITHAGHTHYRLKTGRFGAYMMAKVVRNRVVQLEAWPFEFC